MERRSIPEHLLDEPYDRLREVVESVADYVASQPFRQAHEHDMRGGRYVVRLHVRAAPPAAIADGAAAVVSGVRAALDALATSLAGVPTRFPIHDSLANFAQRTRKALAPMSDEARAAIEALQPYHTIGGYANGRLWQLRELHEGGPPRLAAGFLRDAEMGVNTQRKVSLLGDPAIKYGAFEDGAAIAEVPVKIVGPDPKLDMFLRAGYAMAYAANGPMRGHDLVLGLFALCEHVEEEVFAVLEPLQPR